MEKLHTPEPWRAVNGFDRRWRIHSETVSHLAEVSDPGEANARRIVACVNACRSVSDEDLADDCVEKMRTDRDGILAKRDELLAALRALYGWTKAEVEHFGATCPDDFIIEMVEKALKNA